MRVLPVIVVVAAFALCAASATAAPSLQVAGNRLVDTTTGSAFVPRGVNWPSFEYACFYGYAYSQSAADGSVNPDAAGAAVIAGWHANTVRIPLNEACWLGVDGQPAFGTVGGYRAAVQQWVSTLHAAGLAVILDLHWMAPAGVPAEGQRAMPDVRAADFWSSVAATFKDDHAVMFDLFNEPYSRAGAFDLTWACWRSGGCAVPEVNDQQPVNGRTYPALGMQQMLDALRGAGATQPVLLAGRDYANDLGEWLANRPADPQVVASFHNYGAQTCDTAACWDATIAPIAAQVPVVETEFGATDCGTAHLDAAMGWADAHGVGYLGWGWWVLADRSCQTIALLDDAAGTPRAPNGTALKAHLDALAPTSPAGPLPASPTATPTSASTRPAAGGPAAAAERPVVSVRRTQRLGGAIVVAVGCRAGCLARVAGRIVTTLRGRRRTFGLRRVTKRVAAGPPSRIRLRVSRTPRLAAGRALRGGGHAGALIDVTTTAGVTRLRVMLRR